MASTGRKHGFESLEEMRLLVALDFLGASEVLSQPFRLDFEHVGGPSWHIPDFLALIGGGMWLLDVRPMELIKDEDAMKFAAAREAAAACGWRYSVVAGWRPHVWSVLDHLSSRRRPARDLLGMRDQLLTAIGGRKGRVMTFSELADTTSVPSVGRANIVRLLWQRDLGVDLGSPLRDSSLVWGGVMAARGFLQIAPGRQVAINGVEWTVEDVHGQLGRLVLVDTDGRAETRSFRWLINHPDLRLLPTVEASRRPSPVSRQPRTSGDLTEDQLERARLRVAHVLEAETGFREGHPARALPGEPRPSYDPDRTTLTQRRHAKAAETKAMPRPEAVRLGLQHLSYRTLERLSGLSGDSLLLACADGRWTRQRSGHRSVTEEVREAIFAVKAECGERARLSWAAKHRLIHQYMRERFPTFPTEKIPSRWTLADVWKEWFGPGGARPRYGRTAEAAAEAGVSGRLVVHRPGQVLALDSTPMPVKLRETVFGDAVTATLTLALDLYTHGLPAFRLTPQSDTSIDVAMLLRDVMLPLPMRDGWGEDMEWPYTGVPADVITEFTGHRVAALPFFAPETVTTDHGGPYKNHDLVEAEREIGCRILPARVLRQTDKYAVERQFLTIQTMLFEHLLGFTGGDVADRGADPERDASLTLAQAEHIIATWIVRIWQNRKLGEYAPSWAPSEDHSPNTLFAAAMEQGGFDLDFPEPSFYYKVLRKHHVKIHPRRGVKILGLWYHHQVLDEPRFMQPSARGGRHAGQWVVRSDRRDRRQVFFQDPADHDTWHVLRWQGLPPENEVPAFSDKTADSLLAHVKANNIRIHSESELLEHLLEILGSVTPVDQWPSQTKKKAGKKQRVAQAREITRAQAAAADRPAAPAPTGESTPTEMPVAWAEHARTIDHAVDADRRRRREEALAGTRPVAPPTLHEALSRRPMFLPPPRDASEAHTRIQEDDE
ncbi:transposase [Streptomyces sp. NBC_00562]|nr:transposase [Streptomyces sp. NBC_00562]WUC24883.1 transposase [Streptomyces sp. NBC_00562]